MTKQNLIKTFSLALIVSAAGIFQSCSKSNDATTTNTGDWVKSASFGGVDRSNAVAFEINGLGYVGTGFDGTNRLNDFWCYDPTINGWTQMADFAGDPRSEAVGFSVLGKGYIGLGYDAITNFKDMYEYDPSANTWTAKADFGTTMPAQTHPPAGRYGAVAFAIGNYGYVGTGYDGTSKNDFYKYDPSADIWSAIASFPGEKRMSAVAFVAGNNGYVGTGIYNGIYQKDFFQYNPTTGLWKRMSSLNNTVNNVTYDIRRYGASAFSINGKGYISTGTYTSVLANTWEYTPPTGDTGLGYWVQKGNFEGSARTGAVGLTIGNRGFLLSGKNGNSRYGDMWELKPNATQVW